MAGITDLAFRLICREFGAVLAFVEMLNCRSLSYKSKKTKEMLRADPQDRPLGAQLLGSEIKYILPALEILQSFSIDVIDFNAACPVKKVVKRGEGAALMKEPKKLHKILKAVVKHSRLPVTLKLRAGWSRSSINAKEAALWAQDAGVSAVFIHGRTKEQGYSGEIDYKAIAAAQKALDIPVIGSGNIFSAQHAGKMLENTGCDGVAVARGALGNPWIFKELGAFLQGKKAPPPPPLEETIKVFFTHLDKEIELSGEKAAILLFRKFLGWYFKGVRNVRHMRERSSRAKTREDIVNILKEAQIAT